MAADVRSIDKITTLRVASRTVMRTSSERNHRRTNNAERISPNQAIVESNEPVMVRTRFEWGKPIAEMHCSALWIMRV
jgi:hypothetical protein